MKKFAALFLSFIMIFTMVPVSVFAEEIETEPTVVDEGFCGADESINGENLTWVFDSNGTLTISGTGEMNGYGVAAQAYEGNNGSVCIKSGNTCAPWGQYKDEIKSVVINEGVTSIGGGAFCGCIAMENISIAESVTSYGWLSFGNCTGLAGTFRIGKNVAEIKNQAFLNLDGVTAFEVDSENSKFSTHNGMLTDKEKTVILHCPSGKSGSFDIPEGICGIDIGAFVNCRKLEGELVLPSTLINIWHGAFYGCTGITEVHLPENLNRIDLAAFGGCTKMGTEIHIPASVKYLMNQIFERSSITSVYFEGDAPNVISAPQSGNYYPTFSADTVTLYCPANNDTWTIENGKWNGYNAEKWYPDAVAYGYCGAEEGGTNLSWTLTEDGTLTISGTGEMADYEWNSEKFESSAPWYEHKDNIKTLVLENGITHIGNHAFSRCFYLSGELVIPEGVTSIGDSAFNNTAFTGELVLPSSLEVIGSGAFMSNDFEGDLILPENLEHIFGYAFSGCEFTNVEIPAAVKTIGGGIFSDVKNNITVSEENTNYCSVGGVVFTKDATKLVCFPGGRTGDYTIPDSVITVENRAFNSSKIRKIVVNENVKNINELAFEGISGNIIINGVPEIIEERAFMPYWETVNVYFMGGEPSGVAENAFCTDYDGVINLYYLKGTEDKWNFDENGLWNGYEVTPVDNEEGIPVASGFCGAEESGTNLSWTLAADGTLTISGTGEMADYNDSSVIPWYEYKDNIKTLVLEEGITGIGKYAFYRCTGLTGSLVIPESVTSIGQYAFSNCWNLSGKLVIPKSLVEIGNMAFSNCHGFEAVEVAGENQNYASIDDALYTKDGKTLIYYPGQKTGAYTVHEGTEVIGRMAFYNANVDSVTLPESVKTIEFKAFAHFDGKVTVKGKLDTIEGGAFSEYGEGVSIYFIGGAPLNVETGENPSFITDTENEGQITIYYVDDGSWELDENGLWNGYKVNKINAEDVIIASGFCGAEEDGKNLSWTLTEGGTLTISGTGEMTDYEWNREKFESSAPWYEYKDNIKTLVLEEGITGIGDYAFRYCTNLSGELVIPEGVERIGRGAFTGAGSSKLVLPESLKIVKQHAFMNCDFEGDLILPGNLENIYIYAFAFCKFANVQIPASVSYIGGAAFSGIGGNISISAENENYCAIENIIFTKDGKELVCFTDTRTGSYEIPETVETIGDRSFFGSSLGEIIVPENVKTIEEMAFEAFNGNIIINSALESIGESVFWPFNSGEVNVYFWAGQPSGVSEYAFNEEKGTINLYYLKGTEDKWNFDSEGKWNGFEVLPYTVPEATIEISSEMIALGRNKTVLVELSENSNLEMLQFSLKYDASALKIVSCKTGALTENADINYAKAGFIDFIWDDTNVLTEGGTILEIEFTTAENAAAQKTVVELNEEKEFIAKDSDFVDVSTEVVGGEIEIVDVIYGDIDGSGKVNVIDAHLARLCAAKLITFTDSEKLAADVDGDGRVTAIDANYIRRFSIDIIGEFPVEAEK